MQLSIVSYAHQCITAARRMSMVMKCPVMPLETRVTPMCMATGYTARKC